MKFIDRYLSSVASALNGNDEIIHDAIHMIKNLRDSGGRLWVLGNGGSMAIAQHFAQDLLKMREVKAQTINCPSMITAFSNDIDFSEIFYKPLKTLWERGDAIMIFSCSGSSRNYNFIKDLNCKPVISIVGTSGGFLKNKSDLCVHVKSENYQICETAFCVVADLINMGLEDDRNA